MINNLPNYDWTIQSWSKGDLFANRLKELIRDELLKEIVEVHATRRIARALDEATEKCSCINKCNLKDEVLLNSTVP